MNSTITNWKDIFKPKTARNLELYEDYKNGMPMLKITHKYDITSVRAYKIISMINKKKNLNK